MSDIEFIDGIIVKAPNPKAPEFVKAALSIKRLDLIAWLESRDDEWINADIKESKSGKWYCAVNAFKAAGERQASEPSKPAPSSNFQDDDVPF